MLIAAIILGAPLLLTLASAGAAVERAGPAELHQMGIAGESWGKSRADFQACTVRPPWNWVS